MLFFAFNVYYIIPLLIIKDKRRGLIPRQNDLQMIDMTHCIVRSFYGGVSSLISEQLHSDIVWINGLTSQCLYGYYSVSTSLFKMLRPMQYRIIFRHSHQMFLPPDAFIVTCEYSVSTHEEPDKSCCSSFIWKSGRDGPKLTYVHMSFSLSFPISAGVLSIHSRHAEIYRIRTEDIMYIEASNTYCQIYCCSNQILANQSISSIEKSLPSLFMRTHRSFIVNKQYVRGIYRYGLDLSNGTQLPIPEKRYMKVVCWFET